MEEEKVVGRRENKGGALDENSRKMGLLMPKYV